MANPVVWFEIYVSDMERSKRFYEAVLGVKLNPLNPANPEMWAFPSTMEGYGTGGALARMEGFKPSGNATLVYFHCEDCAVEAGRIPGAGGKVLKEKTSIGQYGFIAIATDLEGNTFGLHSMT